MQFITGVPVQLGCWAPLHLQAHRFAASLCLWGLCPSPERMCRQMCPRRLGDRDISPWVSVSLLSMLGLAGSQPCLSLSAVVQVLQAGVYSYVSTSCMPVSFCALVGHWCFTENCESKVKSDLLSWYGLIFMPSDDQGGDIARSLHPSSRNATQSPEMLHVFN